MDPSNEPFRLGDLPIELILKIFSHLEPAQCTDLALANKICYKFAKEQMLSRYEYSRIRDLEGFELREFSKALEADNGKRRWCLRELQLRNEWYDKLDENGVLSDDERESNVNTFGKWLMRNCTELRYLHVAYRETSDFLRHLPPKLRHLAIRPEGYGEMEYKKSYSNEIEYRGTLDVQFLPAVLRSTALRTLDIGAEDVIGDEVLANCINSLEAESALENLFLKVGNLSNKAMVRLLRAPRNLKVFHYSPICREDLDNSCHLSGCVWGDIDRTTGLPSMSVIGAALQCHAKSLKELTILRGHSHWHSKMNRIGTLTELTSLKYLNISTGTLLGHKHCEHNSSLAYESPVDPSTIAQLLPPNMEVLELFHDQHHYARNGKDYFLKIVRSLLAAHATRQLQYLERVVLRGTQPYCWDCDLAISLEGLPYPLLRAHYMSIQEARKIRDVICEADSPFRFFSRHDGMYWTEENPGYTVIQHVFGKTIDEVEETEGWSEWDRRYPRLDGIPETWRLPDCGANLTGS